MAGPQYDRKVSLLVGTASGSALDFTEFRCIFSVRRGDFQTPNTLDARIYNLSAETANRISTKEFTQVALSAGYAQGNFGLVFRGSIKQVRRGRVNQLDSYTDITAADGDELYNFTTMSLSLAAGSEPGDSVQAFLQSMARQAAAASGRDPSSVTAADIAAVKGQMPELFGNPSVRGRVVFGNTRDELRKFAQSNNLVWSIQDERLTLIPKTSYIPGEPVVISPQNGMLGVPEQMQDGVHVRVLLNPLIKIGQLIKLDSTDVNQFRRGLDSQSFATNITLQSTAKLNADGLYYVMSMDHYGDTRGHGDDWYSEMTCLAVDATISPDAAKAGAVSILPAEASFGQDSKEFQW